MEQNQEDCSNYDTVCAGFVADFQAALHANDVGTLLKLKYFVEDLHTLDRPKLQERLVSTGVLGNAEETIQNLRTVWVKSLTVGGYVDIYSENEIKWFDSKILEVNHEEGQIKVHYNGWQPKYDEYLDVSAKRICPVNSFTKAKKLAVKATAKKQKLAVSPAPVANVNEAPVAEIQKVSAPVAEIQKVSAPVAEIQEAEVSLTERASRRRSRADGVTEVANSENKRRNTSTTAEDAAEAVDKEEKEEKEEKDRNDWVCTICGWFEAPDGSDLACCDAFCKRSFHLGCLQGRMRAPVGDARWYCDDCVVGQHLCFICKQRGTDFVDVHKCNVAHCGKYYHRACLENSADTILVPQFKVAKKKDVMKVVAIPLPAPTLTTTAVAAGEEPAAAEASSPKGNKKAGKGDKTTDAVPASPSAAEIASAALAGATSPGGRATRGLRMDYKAMAGGSSPQGAVVSSPSVYSQGQEQEHEVSTKKTTTTSTTSHATTAEPSVPAFPLSAQPSLLPVPENCAFVLKKTAQNDVLTFKCPLHCCYNCFEFNGAVDTFDLTMCLNCPRAFHTNCILPGSRFNSMCVLCPLHPEAPLPSHDVRHNPLIAAGKKAAPVNEFSRFWEQLGIPEETPNPADPFDNHFKLQVHIKDATEDLPQTFVKITRNDYDTFPEGKPVQGFVPEVACECTIDCGDDCLNRILRIECCDTKIRGRDDSGDQCICAIGGKCMNRAIQSRKYAKTEPFREFQMGFGLRAKEDIESGALIMEYVGEVIDYAEVHRRMTNQRINSPNDKDFYIMELDNGMFVDGKFKGSTSRYINHSCDPNCELQRWVVKGYPRIGIFAIRDIADGEALSYDYQFDTNEAETFKCYCGTDKCRGTMAPKKKKGLVQCDASGRPQSKEERDRLILMGKIKAQSSREDCIEAEWSRSYTSRFIPGDLINEIKAGPVKATLAPGRDARLLLVRTVRKGSNFFDRSQLFERTQRRLAEKLRHSKGKAARK